MYKDMNNVTLTQLFSKKNSIIILIAFLVLGIILVFLSDGEKKESNPSTDIGFDEEEYEINLEKRLKKIVEEISGVGEVNVMVTLEGSAFYSYATDMTQDFGKEGDSKRESTVVLSTGTSSTKEAVVSGYTLPKVKGAAVVCSGNISSSIRAKVISVVSAALGISSARICVTN